jgi:hypothetical protein
MVSDKVKAGLATAGAVGLTLFGDDIRRAITVASGGQPAGGAGGGEQTQDPVEQAAESAGSAINNVVSGVDEGTTQIQSGIANVAAEAEAAGSNVAPGATDAVTDVVSDPDVQEAAAETVTPDSVQAAEAVGEVAGSVVEGTQGSQYDTPEEQQVQEEATESFEEAGALSSSEPTAERSDSGQSISDSEQQAINEAFEGI